MPSPSIGISSPANNATVDRTFMVTGTYVSDTTPTISVVLKDSGGTTVATGSTPTAITGNWYSYISASQAYTDASVTATITGPNVSASVIGLTVS